MRQILLLLCFLPLVLHGQAKITPILPLPDHVEYQEGTFLFPKELRVYAEQATATFQYMKAELEKRFDIRVLQIRQQEKADCILLNTHRNSQSEAYILTIKSSYIKMQADTETGLFYALQSLIQLMDGTRERPMRLAVQCIEDMPRFSWRSFMLDEARFFKGEEEVCRLLDVMAQLKMNVFHWHLTDDQGWRIEIKKYPLLTKIGSKRRDSQSGGFNSEIYIGEPHEGFYTQEQIKRFWLMPKNATLK